MTNSEPSQAVTTTQPQDNAFIKTAVANIQELPTLNEIASELLRLLGDPASSIKDLDKVMRRDPSLAAMILKIVNSSYYGVRHRVSALSHALSLLGYRTVKNVVLTASASGFFKCKSKSAMFDPKGFAKHSVASAAVCKYLANYTGRIEPETAYTIGLLHDIGKLIADQCFPEKYEEAVKLSRTSERPVHECERELWDCDHGTVGAHLCQRWKLPDLVWKIIQLHHSKGLDAPGLLAVCKISDYICWTKHYAAPDTCVPPQLDKEAWESLRLHRAALSQMLTALTREIKDAEDMFNCCIE